MNVNLHGKVAVVTGSTSGIGEGIARVYAENGARVVVTGRREAEGEAVAADISAAGGVAKYIRADVSERESVYALMASAENEFGKIDILVNNAGINVAMDQRGPIHEFPDDMWDKILAVDLSGVYHCSKAALPGMIQRGFGRIINIASIVGAVPLRNQCAFAAAKAGVIQLTKAMAVELGPHGVTVNVILPGSTQITKMTENGGLYTDGRFESIMSHIPMHRPGTPADMAYGALYLASDEAGYVTGAELTIDGGWTSGFARDW